MPNTTQQVGRLGCALVEDAVSRIGIAQPEQHYHMPLPDSSWSYAIYRGT